MKTAVFPGSFDPITLGHLNVIERADRCFDRVIVCVMANCEKGHHLFTVAERVELIRRATAHLPHVEADSWNGLLADYAAQKGVEVLVKGVRNGSDFDSEYQMALINKNINPALETVFFPADAKYLHFSSTMVREMIRYHQNLEAYVPPVVAEELKGR
jgi:pantetheine-phosphate adenylyltransferase